MYIIPNGYLTFPTKEAGWNALRTLIRSRLRHVGLTVMLERWSETPGYAATIRRYVGEERWAACQ